MTNVHFDPRRPIYQQVIAHIEQLIVSGQLSPGQPLPSRRELARKLGINPNTVQRAFSEMEENGWLYTEVGTPSVLTSNEETILKIQKKYMKRIVKNFVDSVKYLNIDLADIMKEIEREMNRNTRKGVDESD